MNTFFNKDIRAQPMPYRREWTQPMWSSGISGPVLVRFHSTEMNAEKTEQLSVYIDVRCIMSIEQLAEGGSTIILTGGVYHDLHEGAADVIKRLNEVVKEITR